MRPEATRLVYRIKTALKGESNGLETANLAWQYAAEVERSQELLRSCSEDEDALKAYIGAYSSPSALDTIDALDFGDADQWRARCELFKWKVPDTVDSDISRKLRDRFAAIEDLKSWLLGEFRSRVRDKRPLEAYQIVKLLIEQFGDDADLLSERQRLETQLIEQLETELASALQELMPAESPEAIVVRYRSYGLNVPKKEGPVSTVVFAIESAATKESASAVEALVAKSKDAQSNEEKLQLEREYFDCDYNLAVEGTRSKIDPALRDAFAAVGTELSHHRASFESNILIQNAIDDLRKILQGISISFGRKKATVHDAKDRLKSLQVQAKKMGRRIPPELQDEIKKALSEANRKRAPKYAIRATGALAALAIIGWFANSQVQTNQYAETLQTATAAINQAAARQNVAQAEEALTEWDDLIEAAPADHALKSAASYLRAWITEQTSLVETYSGIADRLDEIRSIQGVAPNASEIQTLLDSAETTRDQLDIELEGDAESRIAQFESWRETRISDIQTGRKENLLGYTQAAQDNLEQAAAATDSAEFESRSRDIVDASASARALLIKFPDLDANQLQSRSLERIEGSLKGLQEKRDTMLAAQKSIRGATDLASYLKSLEAIYNFDTLPADGKRNVGRILKLENEFASLLQTVVMPGDSEGWIELAGSDDYVNASPSLSNDEKAFLERLIEDSLFPTIFESNVKYFEGAPVAKSEYSVFLADPIQKGDTAGLKTGINFSFKVRGFDESGEAEEEALEMNFLSHPDGTFWGFFYEPSELSNESVYFQESLRLSLMRILAGSPRFSALRLFDELSEDRSLSPAFRAYWQSQLIEFMEIDPWKWGLPLAPTLSEWIESNDLLGANGINERQWLSTVEQISPSTQLTDYFREASKTKLSDEAAAFASFYSNAIKGEMQLIGQVDESGEIEYTLASVRDDSVWVVNHLTGRIESYEEGVPVAPYSPVLVYRFEGKPASSLVQKTRIQTGIDLSDATYASKLPPLFRPN